MRIVGHNVRGLLCKKPFLENRHPGKPAVRKEGLPPLPFARGTIGLQQRKQSKSGGKPPFLTAGLLVESIPESEILARI